MDRDLEVILLADNPWLAQPRSLVPWLRGHLPEPFYPRQGSGKIAERWGDANRAHLVVGPRQAGKSTLIWAHLASVAEPVLFLDCEQALVRDLCRSAPLLLRELEQIVDTRVPLFFEEAQHLTDAGLFLKGLVDRRVDVPILVTRSSSYHLGAGTRESLAGRATRTNLFPFSLDEVSVGAPTRSAVARQHKTEELLERHLRYGGYPEVWLSDAPERLLADLVEAVILRDASDLFRIARPDAFRRLLKLLAGQTGSLINLSEWASILGIGRDTVASYIEILEASHIVASIPPFAGGKRSELTSRHKVYLIDNGIRNHLVGDFGPLAKRADRGATLENWVFTELWTARPSNVSVHFWRSTSKAEVDFVIVDDRPLLGVEVKASALARPTLTRGARSFIEAYAPHTFLVVNTGIEHKQQIAATEVRWVRPWAVAAAVRG